MKGDEYRKMTKEVDRYLEFFIMPVIRHELHEMIKTYHKETITIKDRRKGERRKE